MSVAIVTGASRGLGEALATGAGGGGLVGGDRRTRRRSRSGPRPTGSAARRQPDARVVAVAGDITDLDHRHEPDRRRLRARRARPRGQQRRHAGCLPAPVAGRLPAGRSARRLRGQRRRPPRSRAGRAPPAPRRTPPAPAQHHVGRRRRGLRGLGRLRSRQGGARAPRRGARRRVPGADRVVGRPGRPAHRHAPGRVPRRGHLGPARARHRRARLPRADRERPPERSLPGRPSSCRAGAVA